MLNRLRLEMNNELMIISYSLQYVNTVQAEISRGPFLKSYRSSVCKISLVLTACGMYVVKWESSSIDLWIWDK